MNRRISLILTLLTPALPGCFQSLDSGAAADPTAQGAASTAGASDAATLPDGFSVNAALTQQCEYGSALCYELCGSPSCALPDNTIPSETTTTPIVLPDGGTSLTPCDDINALSMQIRQRACAQCHGPTGPKQAIYNFVLDDQALVSMVPSGVQAPLVIPGQPTKSYLYQRILSGIQGEATGMPPAPGKATNTVSSDVAKTIVYPTAEDLSILYAWIANCVPGAPASGSSTSSDGGSSADAGGTTSDDDAGAHAASADSRS